MLNAEKRKIIFSRVELMLGVVGYGSDNSQTRDGRLEFSCRLWGWGRICDKNRGGCLKWYLSIGAYKKTKLPFPYLGLSVCFFFESGAISVADVYHSFQFGREGGKGMFSVFQLDEREESTGRFAFGKPDPGLYHSIFSEEKQFQRQPAKTASGFSSPAFLISGVSRQLTMR